MTIPSLLILRPPTTTSLPTPSTFTPPPPTFLTGTWQVTHSTLPMWKSKRNVTITYSPVTSASASSQDVPENTKLESIVAYGTFSSDKTKTVKGIETPTPNRPGAYDWRGKGWLMIASSHWEVLGWGEWWCVTYFAKTLFTPAGIDIYSRKREGVGEEVVGGIKKALAKIEHEEMKRLAGELFEVKRD